jgi:DNA-directed RNA polymerase specialized sigma24 family protein
VDAAEFFADSWPGLVPELRRMLANAGAPTRDQEDLLQETAFRLLRMWHAIDFARPTAPLAARIALNVWRDQWRHLGSREQLGMLPDTAAATDTERAVLARVELREVAQALAGLRPQTVGILRKAISDCVGLTSDPEGPVPAAERVARSRARRALVARMATQPAVAAAA